MIFFDCSFDFLFRFVDLVSFILLYRKKVKYNWRFFSLICKWK